MIESIQSYSPTSATQTAQPPSSLGADDFLKLMTTQLANQNPLAPMEDMDFYSQMSQFSSLEQMRTMTDALTGLSTDQANASNRDLLDRHVEFSTPSGQSVSGRVEAVSWEGGVTQLRVDGQEWTLGQVTRVAMAEE